MSRATFAGGAAVPETVGLGGLIRRAGSRVRWPAETENTDRSSCLTRGRRRAPRLGLRAMGRVAGKASGDAEARFIRLTCTDSLALPAGMEETAFALFTGSGGGVTAPVTLRGAASITSPMTGRLLVGAKSGGESCLSLGYSGGCGGGEGARRWRGGAGGVGVTNLAMRKMRLQARRALLRRVSWAAGWTVRLMG